MSTTDQHEMHMGPIITISRQFGAGGHSVANYLLKRLGEGWEIHDKDLVEDLAQSAQVRTQMIEDLDENVRSWMNQMVQTIFKGFVLESMGYRRHLAQVLLTLAHEGKKIIIGRGANFILEEALNVRLEASEAYRTQAVMERNDISLREAVKMVNRVDEERAAFTRTTFNRDLSNPRGYDLVLQTDKLGLDGSAAIIQTAWEEKMKLIDISKAG